MTYNQLIDDDLEYVKKKNMKFMFGSQNSV